MPEYLLLMHASDAAAAPDTSHTWPTYLAALGEMGVFEGGSALGGGVCVTKAGAHAEITRHLTGYIRVQADSLEEAQGLLAGNPVYEAGGTVEIRELPRTS